MRRGILHSFILYSALGVAAAAPARAAMPESVAMPYECALDGARVVLRPSEIRNYPVVGEREERQVTACASPGSSDCRTLMAHRFAISCGGRRVPWMRVVAAARRSASREMWLEGGRIHLAVERRTGEVSRCGEGMRRAGLRAYAEGATGSRLGLPLAECLPWQRDRAMTHVALPPGFAPVGEIGARLLIGGPAPVPAPASTLVVAKAVDRGEPRRLEPAASGSRFDAVGRAPVAASDALTGSGPPLPPQAETGVAGTDQLPEAAPIPIVLTGADPSRTWVTLVRPELQIEGPSLMRGPTMTSWTFATLLASLLAAGAWRMWRRERIAGAGIGADALSAARHGGTGPVSQKARHTGAHPDTAGASAAAERPDGAGAQPGASAAASATTRAADDGASGSGLGGLAGAVRNAARGFPFSRATRATAGAGPRAASSAEVSVVNAAASVTALIEQANGSLDVLRSAPPLREVLEQEIGLVRQRLAIVKAQASDGPEAAHKAAPVFRSLVRDLERVRRISESAALSFSGVRVAGRMPRTKSEAYDALGVNADVSAETLKKLVDALRMCWHPDLARDEQDRLVREERIKCINVSWELISGKRAVG